MKSPKAKGIHPNQWLKNICKQTSAIQQVFSTSKISLLKQIIFAFFFIFDKFLNLFF